MHLILSPSARRDLNDIRDGIVHFGTFWEQVQALFSNFSRKLDHVDRSIKALRKAIVVRAGHSDYI